MPYFTASQTLGIQHQSINMWHHYRTLRSFRVQVLVCKRQKSDGKALLQFPWRNVAGEEEEEEEDEEEEEEKKRQLYLTT